MPNSGSKVCHVQLGLKKKSIVDYLYFDGRHGRHAEFHKGLLHPVQEPGTLMLATEVYSFVLQETMLEVKRPPAMDLAMNASGTRYSHVDQTRP